MSTGESDWNRVAAGAGTVAVALLWLAAALARDVEAFAIGLLLMGVVVVLWFARRRLTRWAGRVAFVVLLLDIAGWMAPAVASNASAGESVGDLLLPLALTAVSAVGLIAWAASLTSARATPRRTAALVAAVGLAGIVVGTLSFVLEGESVVVEPGDVVISTRNVTFSDETLAATAGTMAVVVTNHDLFWHTFTIEEIDVDLRVPTGGTRRVVFDVAPGSYEFVCAIPGHESRMRGILTVR